MKGFFISILLFSSMISAQELYDLKNGRLEIPFYNNGIIANAPVSGISDGRIDSIGFLFSAGFFLSGKDNDTIWSNGVATSSRIEDYQPGNVDSIPYNPSNGIYVVTRSNNTIDDPFGFYWQKWRYAVEHGADFYDGDRDGIYDPVDLNNNGKWDPNEDAPDLIGNITAWCVYNDGVSSENRYFKKEPLGIEIQQTVFAFYSSYNYKFDARSCTFFVRYKILNTGKVSDEFDSVYFGGWADTDLGGSNGFTDDLAGCDTLQNSGYVYNEGADPDFGINPPAHFIKILQGPYSYIADETFIDNNSNGEYDEGIDTPVDTAYNFKGEYKGIDTLPGAKNLGMTSHINYESSVGDPDNQEQMRYYLMGKNQKGVPHNPCSTDDLGDLFGTVLGGVDCSTIPPQFMYSGDPVTQTGWINNYATDQRQLVSAGPFTLKVGEPVTIIVAHIVGRGTDSLNSITVSRGFSEAVEGFYKSNFTDIVVSVDDKNTKPVPSSFILYQNYPNPFNPTTKINFVIPKSSVVNLKVYDILGREVATLVNEEKHPGSYEIEFDGSKLSSGVYFYQLNSGSFISTKKMLIIK